jgi:hypothetical protein
MISNNMIRLAARAHQTELRRVATGAQRATDRSADGTAPASHRLRGAVERMLHITTASRRARGGTVVPRISI